MDGSGMLMLDLTGGFALDLRVLRYFLSVAREESITGAAEYLHLSQPTLSRQLMDLEAEFGKPLFIRGSRKITLTEHGTLLRKRASEILELVEKTAGELTATEEAVAGDIYIGGGESNAPAISDGQSKRSVSLVQRQFRGCERPAGQRLAGFWDPDGAEGFEKIRSHETAGG